MVKHLPHPLRLSLAATSLLGVLNGFLPGMALPPPVLLSQMTAADFNRRGIRRSDQGDYRGAIEDYTQAIRLSPGYAFAHMNRGLARFELRDYQGALEDYTQAIRLKPDYTDAYINRCRLRNDLKDHQGALEDCNRAVRLPVGNFTHIAYNNRGNAHLALKNYREAIADYDEAIRRNPGYAVAYRNRGLAHSAMKDYREAIADFDQAIRLDPSYTLARRNRDLAYQQLNNSFTRQASPPPSYPMPPPAPVVRRPPALPPPPAPTPVAASTPSVNVYNIANQTTVLIDGQNPGSGVIIARSGNTYYVLTAKHVLATPDEYNVVTSNGRKFKIDYDQVKKLANLDLAVVQFTSNENFPIAQLGNSEQVSQGDNIFVSGFPAMSDGPNRDSHQVTDGRITGFRRGDATGYELTYSSPTGSGMSGGPVFNASGRVIGIHGRGAANQEGGKIGINMGIPIHLFLRQAPQAGLNIQQLGLRSQL
jgi:tetratricopeptide (TPR) repeat protein